MKLRQHIFGIVIVLLAVVSRAADSNAAAPITHRINGLFCPAREEDLRQAAKKIPEVQLVSIDFEKAEATFRYDPAKFSKDQLNNALQPAAFEIKPPATTPRDKLTLVDIPIYGLDCKACCYAAYRSIYKIDGVEQATASFKDKRLTALIDPAKVNTAALSEALKKANVELNPPEKPEAEKLK